MFLSLLQCNSNNDNDVVKVYSIRVLTFEEVALRKEKEPPPTKYVDSRDNLMNIYTVMNEIIPSDYQKRYQLVTLHLDEIYFEYMSENIYMAAEIMLNSLCDYYSGKMDLSFQDEVDIPVNVIMEPSQINIEKLYQSIDTGEISSKPVWLQYFYGIVLADKIDPKVGISILIELFDNPTTDEAFKGLISVYILTKYHEYGDVYMNDNKAIQEIIQYADIRMSNAKFTETGSR